MRLISYQDKRTGKKGIGMMNRAMDRALFLEDIGIYFRDMHDLIVSLSSLRAGEREESIKKQLINAAGKEENFIQPVSSLTLLAPIEKPRGDIICLGLNYADHVEESRRFKADQFQKTDSVPSYFSKRVTKATGHDGVIPYYTGIVEKLDYESELVFIIGRTARNVKAKDAQDYIFGYTILNDVSARDIQMRHGQWFFGKSLDGYAPMGPCIVTADEISYPPSLAVQSYVNGELRQDSSTDMFLFDIDYVIEQLSAAMTLAPGTIISTGTPSGVGMGFDPPRFLKPGDVVECSVEKIGTLRSKVEEVKRTFL